VTDFSVLLPREAAGVPSGSLAGGTGVQLCSAWLGAAVRALGCPHREEGDTTALQSIREQLSKMPVSHRGNQAQTRGSK